MCTLKPPVTKDSIVRVKIMKCIYVKKISDICFDQMYEMASSKLHELEMFLYNLL